MNQLTKEEIHNKKKQTWIKHYGVDNIFKSEDFLKKQKLRNDLNRQKRIQDRNLIECKLCKFTAKSLYGLSKHIKRNHNISDKDYYDTYLKKEDEGKCKVCQKETRFYGLTHGYVDYCSKTCMWSHPDTELKRQNTCIKKYGVSHPQKSDKQRQKNKIYWLDNINMKRHLSELWINKWKDVNYRTRMSGVYLEYWKDLNRRKQARIRAIKRIEQQLANDYLSNPCVGFQEPAFFNELQKYTDYKIIQQDHSFKNIIGRFPDGHIPEIKLFIQFDERDHFKDFDCTIYKDCDIQCTKDLESIPGYHVFRVSEKRWKENKEDVINEFKQLLKKE